MALEGTEATLPARQDTAPDRPLEVLIIEARRGPLAVDWLALWKHRELLYFLGWRDIKLRYKQTVFGAAWALLQPILTMAIFSLFFGRFAGMSSATEGIPYPLYVFAGLLPWLFFANAIGNASSSVVSSANLITKVYFPRLIIPFASVGVALVDLALSLVVLALVFWGYRWTPSWQLLLLPVFVFGLVLFALGVGAILSALTVAYRDFRYVVPFMVQTWMFVTPVIYPPSIVPERFRWILWLNPVAGLVDGFRAALLGRPLSSPGVALAFGGAALTFILGLSYFRAFERRFADII